MAQDMIDGLVPVDEEIQNCREFYESFYAHREEFADFPWHAQNVPGRIERLQATISKLGDSYKSDLDALEHDKQLHPPPTHKYNGKLLFRGSQADKSLEVDMVAGKHKQLSYAELRRSRPEYMEFDHHEFVKRIDQKKTAAKEPVKTPGQHVTGKLPRGLKEESRKGKIDPWKNN